jgi:hypothetical protein
LQKPDLKKEKIHIFLVQLPIIKDFSCFFFLLNSRNFQFYQLRIQIERGAVEINFLSSCRSFTFLQQQFLHFPPELMKRKEIVYYAK